MIKNTTKLISTFAALTLLSGCATIFSGTRQNIEVKVVDLHNKVLENSTCVIIDGNGAEYPIMSNPGSANVKRGGSLSVRCNKDGYTQKNMAVGDDFNVVTVVNVLFWPGFIVDGLSGAWKKYPSHYLITMEKK